MMAQNTCNGPSKGKGTTSGLNGGKGIFLLVWWHRLIRLGMAVCGGSNVASNRSRSGGKVKSMIGRAAKKVVCSKEK